MIVAIFGRCCVGKSSVATKLGKKMRYNVRHCGELVKIRAKSLGKTSGELDSLDHEAIDKETQLMVQPSKSPLIVEGCFLDAVIGGRPGVYLVRLVCSDEERSRRFAARPNAMGEDFVARDMRDVRLRETLYGEITSLAQAEVTIDTTTLSADEAAEKIRKWLTTLEHEE